MSVKYQIFVSSTFEDLREERRKVIEAILNLGHIPVGMEVFQASDESQWAHIQRRIEQCDYYVVIVAERYGSELDGKSYTQMEYEFARKCGIPTVAFLLHGDARKTWPRDKVDFDKAGKVDAFRSLCQQKLVKHWSNRDELAMQVILSLTELTRDDPRVGWVRADNTPSDDVLAELARLSEEKRQLQAQVETLSASKQIVIPSDVQIRIDQLQDKLLRTETDSDAEEASGPSLLEVFLQLHSILGRGSEQWEIVERLNGQYPYLNRGYDVVEYLVSEFVTNRLLEVMRHSRNGRAVKLNRLSNYGKDFAMYAQSYASSQQRPQTP